MILTGCADRYNNDTCEYSLASALGHLGIKKCVIDFKYDVKPGKNVNSVNRGMTRSCAKR